VAQPHPSHPFDQVIARIDAVLAETALSAPDPPDSSCLRGLGVTFAEATAGVPALRAAIRAEQQQMNAAASGLERHHAVLTGAPMSVLHDPDWLPADQPQDLVGGHDLNADACPPRPPEPPQARQPWWRRLLGRAS